MQQITPYLWFDHQAEEAANFYVSIFPNSEITNTSYFQENTPGKPGSVMVVTFKLNGQEFGALNGGTIFTFTPATSFLVNCESQEEIDYYWDKLLEGGKADQCGWLRDKFGVSWQIVPSILGRLTNDPDKAKAGRVMQAMLKMVKIDIQALENAYNHE